MSGASWKKLGEVVIDVVEVALVIAATVLIEKLLRTSGSGSSGNDSEPDSSRQSDERPINVGSTIDE